MIVFNFSLELPIVEEVRRRERGWMIHQPPRPRQGQLPVRGKQEMDQLHPSQDLVLEVTTNKGQTSGLGATLRMFRRLLQQLQPRLPQQLKQPGEAIIIKVSFNFKCIFILLKTFPFR